MHQEVAKWLYEKIMSEGDVYQDEAVTEIAQKFGEEYTYINEFGNPAIDRKVLREFGKIKGGDIVWDGGEKFWYKETGAEKELKPLVVDMSQMELESFEFDNDFEVK